MTIISQIGETALALDDAHDSLCVSDTGTPQASAGQYWDLLDLNCAREQPPEGWLVQKRFDIPALKAALAWHVPEIVRRYFPNARFDKNGKEARLGDIQGSRPKKDGSCVVDLKTGRWYDHSTAQGGDVLSLLKHGSGLHGIALFNLAAEISGMPRAKANGYANGHDHKTDSDDAAREVAWTKERCIPLAGTAGETYYRNRVGYAPDCDDLQFHPDLTVFSDTPGVIAGRGYPGIVAVVRKPDTGEETGGIHQTILNDDGTAKADIPKPKKMRGPCRGGVVMLMPMREDGVLGVAEGLETSAAAIKIFGIPVWATLSAGNMPTFMPPPDLKQLVIFADKGTAGEQAAWALHAKMVAADIDASVYLPHGGDDLADDLQRGECRAETYLPCRPIDLQLPSSIAQIQEHPAQRGDIEVIHFRDMQPRIEDRTIVGDLLNQRETSLAVGDSATAKTFLAIDLGLHVAAGRDWFDRATKQSGVIYIAAEAGRGIVNRVAAYKLHYQGTPDDLPFAAIVSPVNLREAFGSNGLMEVVAAIESAGLAAPVGLIIVDTLSRAMAGGDENSSEDMGEFVRNIDMLRASTAAHVMIVHHLGKDKSRGARGHSLLHAAVDTEITITRSEATGISTAKVTKQRELPTAGQINYRLHSVELGRDQNDRPVTSCVVEPAGEDEFETGRSKAKLSKKQRYALDLLADVVAHHGEIPPATNYIPAKKYCVPESSWRDYCYARQISDSNDQGSKQKAFKRAAQALVEAGLVGKWQNWVWVV
jgi:hypothetical protein